MVAQRMIDRIHGQLGDSIKTIRRGRGFSLRDVAETACVGHGRLHAIEEKFYGSDGWSLGLLCRIAWALGYEVVVEIKPAGRK